MGKKIYRMPRHLGNDIAYHQLVGGIDRYEEVMESLPANSVEDEKYPEFDDMGSEYTCYVYESPDWGDIIPYEIVSLDIEYDRTKIQANKLKEARR